MAEKHLIDAIRKRAKKMPAHERISKVKTLASGSAEDEEFTRKTFPELYREAFPSSQSSSEDERWESGRSTGLAARRR